MVGVLSFAQLEALLGSFIAANYEHIRTDLRHSPVRPGYLLLAGVMNLYASDLVLGIYA